MKFYRSSEKINMTRFMMAALLVAVSVVPVRAAGTYDASVGARFIDLDFKGNRGQVQEYDGKLYRDANGDVSVSNQGDLGLFDFSLKDIGSTEENGYLNIDYKSSLKVSGKWENMHHRQNYVRSGMVIDGVYLANPFVVTGNSSGTTPTANLMIRRTESEIKVGLFDPDNSARFFTGQVLMVEKKGQTSAKYYGRLPAGTAPVTAAASRPATDAANVDNTKTDLVLGLGTNLREAGAMSLDVIRSEFVDAAAAITPWYAGNTNVIKPVNGRQEMTAGEGMFRYDASKTLALTGAITGRQRENLENQYNMNVAVATLNAAYKASQKLSLTARLYARMLQIDGNPGFRPLSPLVTTASQIDNRTQMDKTTVRGELVANYRPVEKVNLKASYKFELNHRVGAVSMNEPLTANNTVTFNDGSHLVPGVTNNDVALEDIKHIGKLSGKVELPFGMEVEGDYQRMQATRAAFVNMPNWQDDMNVTFSAALPKDVEFTLMGGYIRERNTRSQLSQYNSQRNTYRTGLDWAGSRKVSFGADASYEKSRTRTNAWLGDPNATTFTSYVEHGMLNSQRNTTASVHGRVNCPKGFAVTANGSYTWSVVQVPTSVYNALAPQWASINDYAPSEVRIARGIVGVEYTPEKFKNLTARASYSIDDYVDKTETSNSGRASVTQIGASMKF